MRWTGSAALPAKRTNGVPLARSSPTPPPETPSPPRQRWRPRRPQSYAPPAVQLALRQPRGAAGGDGSSGNCAAPGNYREAAKGASTDASRATDVAFVELSFNSSCSFGDADEVPCAAPQATPPRSSHGGAAAGLGSYGADYCRIVFTEDGEATAVECGPGSDGAVQGSSSHARSSAAIQTLIGDTDENVCADHVPHRSPARTGADAANLTESASFAVNGSRTTSLQQLGITASALNLTLTGSHRELAQALLRDAAQHSAPTLHGHEPHLARPGTERDATAAETAVGKNASGRAALLERGCTDAEESSDFNDTIGRRTDVDHVFVSTDGAAWGAAGLHVLSERGTSLPLGATAASGIDDLRATLRQLAGSSSLTATGRSAPRHGPQAHEAKNSTENQRQPVTTVPMRTQAALRRLLMASPDALVCPAAPSTSTRAEGSLESPPRSGSLPVALRTDEMLTRIAVERRFGALSARTCETPARRQNAYPPHARGATSSSVLPNAQTSCFELPACVVQGDLHVSLGDFSVCSLASSTLTHGATSPDRSDAPAEADRSAREPTPSMGLSAAGRLPPSLPGPLPAARPPNEPGAPPARAVASIRHTKTKGVAISRATGGASERRLPAVLSPLTRSTPAAAVGTTPTGVTAALRAAIAQRQQILDQHASQLSAEENFVAVQQWCDRVRLVPVPTDTGTPALDSPSTLPSATPWLSTHSAREALGAASSTAMGTSGTAFSFMDIPHTQRPCTPCYEEDPQVAHEALMEAAVVDEQAVRRHNALARQRLLDQAAAGLRQDAGGQRREGSRAGLGSLYSAECSGAPSEKRHMSTYHRGSFLRQSGALSSDAEEFDGRGTSSLTAASLPFSDAVPSASQRLAARFRPFERHDSAASGGGGECIAALYSSNGAGSRTGEGTRDESDSAMARSQQRIRTAVRALLRPPKDELRPWAPAPLPTVTVMTRCAPAAGVESALAITDTPHDPHPSSAQSVLARGSSRSRFLTEDGSPSSLRRACARERKRSESSVTSATPQTCLSHARSQETTDTRPLSSTRSANHSHFANEAELAITASEQRLLLFLWQVALQPIRSTLTAPDRQPVAGGPSRSEVASQSRHLWNYLLSLPPAAAVTADTCSALQAVLPDADAPPKACGAGASSSAVERVADCYTGKCYNARSPVQLHEAHSLLLRATPQPRELPGALCAREGLHEASWPPALPLTLYTECPLEPLLRSVRASISASGRLCTPQSSSAAADALLVDGVTLLRQLPPAVLQYMSSHAGAEALEKACTRLQRSTRAKSRRADGTPTSPHAHVPPSGPFNVDPLSARSPTTPLLQSEALPSWVQREWRQVLDGTLAASPSKAPPASLIALPCTTRSPSMPASTRRVCAFKLNVDTAVCLCDWRAGALKDGADEWARIMDARHASAVAAEVASVRGSVAHSEAATQRSSVLVGGKQLGSVTTAPDTRTASLVGDLRQPCLPDILPTRVRASLAARGTAGKSYMEWIGQFNRSDERDARASSLHAAQRSHSVAMRASGEWEQPFASTTEPSLRAWRVEDGGPPLTPNGVPYAPTSTANGGNGTGRGCYCLDMRHLYVAASLAAEHADKVLLPRLASLRSEYSQQRTTLLQLSNGCPSAVQQETSSLSTRPRTNADAAELSVPGESAHGRPASSPALPREDFADAVESWHLVQCLLDLETTYAATLRELFGLEQTITHFNEHVDAYNAYQSSQQRLWGPVYRSSLAIAYLLCHYLRTHGMEELPENYVPLLHPVALFVGCAGGHRELRSKLKEVLMDVEERAKRVQLHVHFLPAWLLDAAASAVSKDADDTPVCDGPSTMESANAAAEMLSHDACAQSASSVPPDSPHASRQSSQAAPPRPWCAASDVVSCLATEQDALHAPLAAVPLPAERFFGVPPLSRRALASSPRT